MWTSGIVGAILRLAAYGRSMRVLDLFSGIGGFSLGLERAGMHTVAFCEVEPYCRAVLGKHWPGVPIYGDVRDLTAEQLRADGIAADVICGGFPCQDISEAGRGDGIDGSRSGLWSEFARLIREIRPRYAIVENVSALLNRGLDKVLGDLAAVGYDAQWHCIPASSVGAHHERDRVWIVAYPDDAERRTDAAPCGRVARPERVSQGQESPGRSGSSSENVADAEGEPKWSRLCASIAAEVGRRRSGDGCGARLGWPAEPDVGRVAHGIPARMDRLRGLGNAVVPQIPQIIGEAIMAVEAEIY